MVQRVMEGDKGSGLGDGASYGNGCDGWVSEMGIIIGIEKCGYH